VCASLHPHAPRLIFFFLKKGKLLSQRNREGFTELCNRKTRAHARTRARTYARTHTHKPHMAKQAREVGLVHDLPHLLQGEQWGPVSCAKASQEEVAEDLYSVCVCVCVCVYLFTNFSPRLSCTVSRLFITLHKNKLQVHWVKSQKKEKCHDGQPLTVDVRACVCFVKEHARACTYRHLLHPSLEFRV